MRERTGRGQQVGATIWAGLEPLDYFVAAVVQLMKKRGEKPSGDARSALSASRYGVLVVTKDGRFIQTSTLLPHQGWALSEVAGIAGALAEPRFARLPSFPTAEVAQEWEDMLLEAFREHDLDHWLPGLLASPDIAFEVAGTCEQGLDHPQIVHNGDVVTIEDPRHRSGAAGRSAGALRRLADAARPLSAGSRRARRAADRSTDSAGSRRRLPSTRCPD